MARAADFAGVGGVIPDNNATGLDIPISVSGLAQPVGKVRIAITLSHTFVGDLRATLISPAGTARLVLFSRTGFKRATLAGISNNLQGTYVFDDDASGDFWQNVQVVGPMVPGSYRTSTAGVPGLSDHGGCATYLGRAFGGLSGADANGTWTLNIADLSGTDTGTVASVLLSIDAEIDLFQNGFEDGGQPSATAPGSRNCSRPFYDMTGTGLTSYVVVRNTGGGPMGAITWSVKDNNGTTGGATSSFVLGTAQDTFLEGDFDGDGIGDAAVWRAGTYTIRRSSRPSQLLTATFGATGDDVQQLGDYDGDGITDFAVYRNGPMAGSPSFTLVRFSTTGELRTYQTGENGAFAGGGSDLDGDGKSDMAIQTNGGGGTGRFRLFGGLDGVVFDDFTFGTPTDVFVTGSHVGTPVGDITTVRGVGGILTWTTRDGDTGVGQPGVMLGVSATDFILAGDYDGDGIDDYAVWRPNADPALVKFIVRRSSTPAMPLEVNLGQNGDYPVARGRAH